MNDKIENVPRRRLKLQAKAQDLYPQDYDLESLFTDFHERKKLKDIERGSKAQKQLRKEAEKEQQDAINKELNRSNTTT